MGDSAPTSPRRLHSEPKSAKTLRKEVWRLSRGRIGFHDVGMPDHEELDWVSI